VAQFNIFDGNNNNLKKKNSCTIIHSFIHSFIQSKTEYFAFTIRYTFILIPANEEKPEENSVSEKQKRRNG
jgi:hypothetical protein